MKRTKDAKRTAVRAHKVTSARTLLVQFYPYVKKDMSFIACALCALAGIVVAEMSLPILIRNVIDTFSLQQAPETLIEHIYGISMQYLGIMCAILIFTFAQNYLMAIVGQRFMLRLRSTLFQHITAQSYSFFNTQPIGKLISRITNDVEGIQELFNNILTGLLRNIATLVGVLITMALINVRLTLFTLLALPVIIPISIIFNRMLRRASLAVREATAKLTAFISEHITGMYMVQIFSKEKRDRQQFRKNNDMLQKKMVQEIYTNAVFRPILDLCAAVLIAYTFVVSGVLQSREVISVGVVVAFLSLINRFFQQLTGIADNFLTIQSGLSGLERVTEALEYAHIPILPHLNNEHVISSGVIKFDKVCFSYTSKKETLHDITFRIHPGETVALVGYTGSGKTTIANLLSRLWHVNSGTITIDGYGIETFSATHLYRSIAVSGQQIVLFDNTIRENIALGSTLSDAQIQHAAEIAHAHSFIQKLPQQYDTRLTNGGKNQFSFGQQQLLTFARIIAHDPKIIILDEATSSIDTETEKKIQSAIQLLLADRSALVIAHRLSTIKHAHRILVLSDGNIIESGTHDELLARNGYYATLWEYQSNNNTKEK